MVTKQRNSAIELLRIIAMIMITFHHFACHGGFAYIASDFSIPHLWYSLILMGGKIGVDIFVLISGYFLIKDDRSVFNLKRILKFWGQIFFYSVVIYLIFLICGIEQFDFETFIKILTPITSSEWWFASTYFVLYLIHPFLNKMLTNLTRKNYQILLVIALASWCLIPTLTGLSFQGNSLIWFITLYALAGYIQIYNLKFKFTSKQYFAIAAACLFITYMSSIMLAWLGTKWDFFADDIFYFYGQEKLPVVLSAISIFMAFATSKLHYHKSINIIASATFGVYLIHDNSLVRTFLWQTIFHNATYQNSLWLIPVSIVAVAVVFTTCVFIDIIRQRFIEKPYIKFLDHCLDAKKSV